MFKVAKPKHLIRGLREAQVIRLRDHRRAGDGNMPGCGGTLDVLTRGQIEVARAANSGSNSPMLLILMGLSLGLWIVFAKLIAPALIESACRGEKLAVPQPLAWRVHDASRGDLLQDWNCVAATGFLCGVGFWLVALLISSPAIVRPAPRAAPEHFNIELALLGDEGKSHRTAGAGVGMDGHP